MFSRMRWPIYTFMLQNCLGKVHSACLVTDSTLAHENKADFFFFCASHASERYQSSWHCIRYRPSSRWSQICLLECKVEVRYMILPLLQLRRFSFLHTYSPTKHAMSHKVRSGEAVRRMSSRRRIGLCLKTAIFADATSTTFHLLSALTRVAVFNSTIFLALIIR